MCSSELLHIFDKAIESLDHEGPHEFFIAVSPQYHQVRSLFSKYIDNLETDDHIIFTQNLSLIIFDSDTINIKPYETKLLLQNLLDLQIPLYNIDGLQLND